MTTPYQWLQFSAAKTLLSQRLADPTFQFWTNVECGLYITEALRVWNALTEQWNSPFSFNPVANQTWYNLSTAAGSPRLRTLQDSDLYTLMQYHLLEPPTGAGTWTGTSQFSLSDLQGALQRRRDQVIQFSGCNLYELKPYPSTMGVTRVNLPDSTLEPVRARFLPKSVLANVSLSREDEQVFDSFEPDHLGSSAVPSSWSVISGPPLGIDTDVPPSVAGSFDLLAVWAGLPFNPPATTLLGVPDDWAWVCKWGALADLLARDSEATDRERSSYCYQRYLDGIKAMVGANWLLDAQINGVPCETPSVAEMDRFSPDWEENEGGTYVISAAIDFLAPCPVGATGNTILVNVVGNAPVPVNDNDFVQVSRDAIDPILDYAQHLAAFKMGGQEFKDTAELLGNFARFAMATNKRLVNLGLFSDVLRSEGKRQQVNQPRD